MTSKTLSEIMDEARKMGAEHGQNAASWYFDGNTTDETYRRVLKGIEEGDPEILDTFPSSPLSGEWADDPTPTTLFRDLGLDAHAEATFNPEAFDEVCSAYEDGFYEAVSHEIERVARPHA
jgi:hypothetical protein